MERFWVSRTPKPLIFHTNGKQRHYADRSRAVVDDAEYTRQTSRAPQRVAWVLWSASMPYAVGRGAYMCGAEGLSLALACAERCYGAAALGLLCLLGSGEIDGAELLLVAHDVVLKGEEQTLGEIGRAHV